MIEKTCKTCELYAHCSHYETIPEKENGCKDWEIAFTIYKELPNYEKNEILKYCHKNTHQE